MHFLRHASFLILVAITQFDAIAQAVSVKGAPRVVDGDTLTIGTTKIRLEGIDAPETDQICLNVDGVRWTCGIDARDQLTNHIKGREITCTANGVDAYKRTLGTCSLDGEDLNAWMVREGWAMAFVKYSSVYRDAENDARVRKRGLWQGAFIAPWDWRHRNNMTDILGALSVPIKAQSMLMPRSASEGAPSPECTIKGNVNRTGNRIYHMPNQQFYSRIRMDAGGGPRWFCTIDEAEAAGWRKALR